MLDKLCGFVDQELMHPTFQFRTFHNWYDELDARNLLTSSRQPSRYRN